MYYLTLHFAGDKPELVKTYFCTKEHHCSGCCRLAVRGKTSGAYKEDNTFQWTSAVRALSILLLRTLSNCEQTENHLEVLEGYAGSIAASLDESIAKETNWLLDMFGVDASDNPIIKRLVKRSNSRLRRVGPVGISINPNYLSPHRIKVFLNHHLIEGRDEIVALVGLLEQGVVEKSSFNRSSTNRTKQNVTFCQEAVMP